MPGPPVQYYALQCHRAAHRSEDAGPAAAPCLNAAGAPRAAAGAGGGRGSGTLAAAAPPPFPFSSAGMPCRRATACLSVRLQGGKQAQPPKHAGGLPQGDALPRWPQACEPQEQLAAGSVLG